MKIHIIGVSGSGKTYFANKLQTYYKIPHYDLDHVYWDNASTYGTKKTRLRRDKELEGILQQSQWIVEGIYHSWVKQCFHDADIIFVMDIPPYIYKRRILTRYLKHKLHLTVGKRETLSDVIKLLSWTKQFQLINMKEIKSMLKPYHKKTVWIHNSHDIKKYFHRLTP